MSDLIRALERTLADLTSASTGWALVGGLAVSVRSEPRTTRDVDVAIAVADDDEAEALVREFVRMGYGVMGGVEQTETGRLATMRLLPPVAGSHGALVDFLFATSGIEAEVCALAEPLEVLDGVVAPVALIGHLIAMKLLSRDDDHRPQDIIDLRSLILVATDEDIDLARTAARQIESRGFSRGRDLASALGDALRRFRPTP